MSGKRLTVAMAPKVRTLDPVTVNSTLTESEFKEKVLNTTPVLTKEEELARENAQIMRRIALYAPQQSMNANDNYLDYMKGPQGVVLFSNKPGKGLISAVKNIVKPKKLVYKRPNSNTAPLPLNEIKFNVIKDSKSMEANSGYDSLKQDSSRLRPVKQM